MKHYAGLDVSIKETSVCVLDEDGRIVREVKVPSHPDDLASVLLDQAHPLDQVGLEAGPLSQWLFSGLAEKGVPVVCIETRHTKAFLKAQPNKSDRNDARGIAQMMRVKLYRPVHVKTLRSQHRRALLSARKLLQEKAIAIENDIRGLLRNFGLKVGTVGSGGFEARVRELVGDRPELQEIMSRSSPPAARYATALPSFIAGAGRGEGRHGLPPTDERAWRRTSRRARLHRHDRRNRPFPDGALRRPRPWSHTDPAPVRRDQPRRPHLALRRRHDAQPPL